MSDYKLSPEYPTDEMVLEGATHPLLMEAPTINQRMVKQIWQMMRAKIPCPWTKIEGPETLPAVELIVQVIRPSVASGSVRQYAYYEQDPASDSVVWFCPITNQPLDTKPTHHTPLPDPPKD